jgi:HK97 family phage prohead protease
MEQMEQMDRQMDRKLVSFEVKSVAPDGSTGEGLASVFFNVDAVKEVVSDTAFDGTLDSFLADGFISGLNHNWESPIGRPTKAVKTARGLLIAWKLAPTAHGRDVMELLKAKVVRKLSIGYRVLASRFLTLPELKSYWMAKRYTPTALDLERAVDGVRLLEQIKLWEAGPVVVPANEEAAILAVKSDLVNLRDFQQWLHRECGMPLSYTKQFVHRIKQQCGYGKHAPAEHARLSEEQSHWTSIRGAHKSPSRTPSSRPPNDPLTQIYLTSLKLQNDLRRDQLRREVARMPVEFAPKSPPRAPRQKSPEEVHRDFMQGEVERQLRQFHRQFGYTRRGRR